MLDFSKYYEQLAIFRTAANSTLWHEYRMNITDVPVLFTVYRNRTIEQIKVPQNITYVESKSDELHTNASFCFSIDSSDTVGNRNRFNYAIRSFIHKGRYIENFDDRDLEEIIRSKNPTAAVGNKREFNQEPADHADPKTTPGKINMVDLETALSYMLRRDIPRVKEIQGEVYDALLHWLIVLNKVCFKEESFGFRRIDSTEHCERMQSTERQRTENTECHSHRILSFSIFLVGNP